MRLVPRELRPGLYRMCWALWLRRNPHIPTSRGITSIMMLSLGRCCLLDFSLVVGDVSRPSLFDMLSFETFPDQLQVSVMSIRRLV